MTNQEIQAILDDIDVLDFRLVWNYPYLQVGAYIFNQDMCDIEFMKGRKWYISAHSTESEIVQTVLKAVLTYQEHETREAFRYRDVKVFSPHREMAALLEIADREEHRD